MTAEGDARAVVEHEVGAAHLGDGLNQRQAEPDARQGAAFFKAHGAFQHPRAPGAGFVDERQDRGDAGGQRAGHGATLTKGGKLGETAGDSGSDAPHLIA